jgi:deoxyribonuclease-4
VSHGSYLINLATDLPVLRELSIGALLDELDRAQALGLHGVVVHPGVRTSGAERQALRLVADAIRTAFAMRPENTTAVLLEHTAGQGRALGCRFEHFADILDRLQTTERIGICLDTCHLAASGYDLVSEAGYDRTFAEFDRLIGLGLVRVFHANDSKRPCGSRVDRHEHIGKGCLGLEPFQRLLHDGRFSGLPMLIETAKSPAASRTGRVCLDPLDVENLNTLRRLRQRPALGTSLAIP